jgi:hypothetical protein
LATVLPTLNDSRSFLIRNSLKNEYISKKVNGWDMEYYADSVVPSFHKEGPLVEPLHNFYRLGNAEIRCCYAGFPALPGNA